MPAENSPRDSSRDSSPEGKRAKLIETDPSALTFRHEEDTDIDLPQASLVQEIDVLQTVCGLETCKIVGNLYELISCDGLTLYGSRPRNAQKIDRFLEELNNDPNSIHNFWCQSSLAIIVTRTELDQCCVLNADCNYYQFKEGGLKSMKGLLIDGSQRLSAARTFFVENPNDELTKATPLTTTVYIVPSHLELEFLDALERTENAVSGDQAASSTFQLQVAAHLEKARLKSEQKGRKARFGLDRPSYIEMVEWCLAVSESIKQNGGIVSYETAVKNGLPSKTVNEIWAGAFSVSQAKDMELIHTIRRLFSHDRFKSFALYHVSVSIFIRAHKSHYAETLAIIDQLINDPAITSNVSLNKYIVDHLAPFAEKVRSTTKNAIYKKEKRDAEENKRWAAKLFQGIAWQVDGVVDPTLSSDGNTPMEKLRSCVRGALSSISRYQMDDFINRIDGAVALYRTQADMDTSPWIEAFLANGGIVFIGEIKGEIDYRAIYKLGEAVDELVFETKPFFGSVQNLKKNPPIDCGILAKRSSINEAAITLPEKIDSIVQPKTVKHIFENCGIDTDRFVVVNFVV